MIEKPTPRFGLMPFSWSIRLTRPAINQTTKIVIAICKSYEHDVSPDAHRPGQDYYPSTSTGNDTILLPLSNSEQMTPVLKQTAGIYGIGVATITPCSTAIAPSGNISCRPPHRLIATGCGRSLHASSRDRFTVADIQKHASKR
jgi:hypothetical protein